MCSTPFGINERGTRPDLRALRRRRGCSTPFGINERGTRWRGWVVPRISGCSTPFGINERGTGRRCHPHQLLNDLCSTPFGINERGTGYGEAKVGELLLVLNAFRHQRTRNVLGAMLGDAIVACSTPFGINERGTAPASLLVRVRLARAQRLSASTNEERCVPGGLLGVKLVLNAFRHQRTRNPRSRRRVAQSESVLNAFRHQRTRNAQRPQRHPRRLDVLNAFRHQRTRNLRPPLGRPRKSRVLNAFRHQRTRNLCFPRLTILSPGAQRLSASTNEEPQQRTIRRECDVMCSTPFGINERGTGGRDWNAVLFAVCSTPFGINERGTAIISGIGSALIACSTPFGINERGTPSAVVSCRPQSPCSTPFGINERGTPNEFGRILRFTRVLNAFRHQRTRNLTPPKACCGCHTGAQRLSASTNEERPLAVVSCRPQSPCSTPFGINERGTPDGVAWKDSAIECSTPFGINERGTSQIMESSLPAVVMCSTPFGINERGTAASRSRCCSILTSAQRLSASTNEERRWLGLSVDRKRSSAQRLSASTNEEPSS